VLIGGFSGAVAVHAHQIQNDRVVHDAVDGRHGRHGVFENAVPVRKHQICRDGDTPTFVAFGTKLSILPGSLILTRNGNGRCMR
jgi:hypothetical protein